jgi:hypothetical protein
MFGGWRDIYCHSYDEIKGLKTENKLLYSPFLDEVDKMTIETTDATYILRGINPKKLYTAISEYVNKYNREAAVLRGDRGNSIKESV